MDASETKWIEIYLPDSRLPKAVLCDIDGTLARKLEGNGARHPFDFARCEEDTLDPTVFNHLDLLYSAGYKVILMSGRPADWREHTERWLARYAVPYDELHMRPSGDFGRDDLVKYALFNEHVRHRFKVELSLDDRDRVVRMWRELGIPCWQVNYGDF